MTNAPLACVRHNHKHCISDALAAAHKLGAERGVRLTELRQQVLTLIWDSHKPLGAYTLMEMLAEESTRRVAPPTVYRTLDFLLEQGLIHRINILNAFVGCPSPEHHHQSHFLLCRHCGVAVELESEQINRDILKVAQAAGFSVDSHALEVSGTCARCQEKNS
jgi:Fur family transcriptional regulator, zinc uptake regulator